MVNPALLMVNQTISSAEQQCQNTTKTVSVDINFTEEIAGTVQDENFLYNNSFVCCPKKLSPRILEVRQAQTNTYNYHTM